MNITASIRNSAGLNEIKLSTQGAEKSVNISAKPDGRGSSINGGELLCLAIATCYCNDIYREAAKRGMSIESVDVTVNSVFGKEGEPASKIEYNVAIQSEHTEQEIQDLIQYVDRIAEVHNTIRKGIEVNLKMKK